jgi:NitT/TauT family transport system substrate-binding protein
MRPSTRFRRPLGVIAATLLMALSWSGGSPTSQASAQTALIPLRVATIPSDFGAQVYYAKDMGFFEKAGLNVDVVPIGSGPAIVAAVIGGSVDVGFSNALSLSVAHGKGVPVAIIAAANLYNTSTATIGLVAVPRASTINSAKDFNGKVIAVSGLNTMPQLGLRYWIDRNGGDSSTVKFIEIPIPSIPQALLAGRADATAQLDPTLDPTLGQRDDPFRLIAKAYDALSPHFLSGAWFSSEQWVAKNPVAAKKFTEVMKQTAVWASTHHHESAVILAKYLNVEPAAYENAVRVEYGTTVTAALLQPTVNLAAKYGLISAPFDARLLIAPL